MSDDRKPFINWTYDSEINHERSEALMYVLTFIRRGLQNAVGEMEDADAFASYEAFVKSAIFENCRSGVVGKIPRKFQSPAGDTVTIFSEVFSAEHKWLGRGIEPAAFHLQNDALTEAFRRAIGANWHTSAFQTGVGNVGLQAAYRIAEANLARTCTRLSLISTIASLLKLRQNPIGRDRVRNNLWEKKVTFQRDLMVFGGLLGGEFLTGAINIVAPQTCYTPPGGNTKLGIMHFLSKDGVGPGRWMVSEEEKLEQDINERFNYLVKS